MFVVKRDTILTFLDGISVCSPDARVFIRDDGLETIHVDTANVAVARIYLPADSFVEYPELEEGMIIGLNVDPLKKMVKAMGEELKITIEGIHLLVNDGTIKFDSRMLDVNAIRRTPPMPDGNLPECARVSGEILNKAVTVSGLVGDIVTLKKTGNVLALLAEGALDTVTIPITYDAKKDSPDALSLFSLEFLKSFAKQVKDSSEVVISNTTDSVVRIDGIVNGVNITYALAPRIEAEE